MPNWNTYLLLNLNSLNSFFNWLNFRVSLSIDQNKQRDRITVSIELKSRQTPEPILLGEIRLFGFQTRPSRDKIRVMLDSISSINLVTGQPVPYRHFVDKAPRQMLLHENGLSVRHADICFSRDRLLSYMLIRYDDSLMCIFNLLQFGAKITENGKDQESGVRSQMVLALPDYFNFPFLFANISLTFEGGNVIDWSWKDFICLLDEFLSIFLANKIKLIILRNNR